MIPDGPADPATTACADHTVATWSDWRWLVVVIAVLLAAVGSVNITLHGRADEATAAGAAAVSLRGLLHEESTLQWRELAERGPALEVARRMGELRRQENEERDRLTAHRPELAESLTTAMTDYHDAIDRELGLLAVGLVDEALETEWDQTSPLFEGLDDLLVKASDRAAVSAGDAHRRANVTLAGALAVILLAIGVLLQRVQGAHREAARAITTMLDQERTASASLERARAMVHHQATHDPLTDLRNRLGLREGLRDLVDKAGATLCVVFIDLDGFKAINDRYGHERGDRVLNAIADSLRSQVRSGELVARMGGDEFAMVAEVPDEEAGRAVAARVRHTIVSTCAAHGLGTGLGASIGVAIGPADEIRLLLARADEDMYREKRSRRPALVRDA